jgi:hypothetical protein
MKFSTDKPPIYLPDADPVRTIQVANSGKRMAVATTHRGVTSSEAAIVNSPDIPDIPIESTQDVAVIPTTNEKLASAGLNRAVKLVQPSNAGHGRRRFTEIPRDK